MSKAWALGLYRYSAEPVSAANFELFHDLIVELFTTVEATPTYIAVEGVGFKGRFTKFGGRTHARLLKNRFADIEVLSLVSNPKNSDAPGYDSHCSASMAFLPTSHETLLCLSIEERFAEFGGEVFNAALDRLLKLQEWDYGFALCQPIEKKPEFHILGLNDGNLSTEDNRRLNAWYAAPPEIRLTMLRDVYPYLILNEHQLTRKLLDECSLRERIAADKRLSLTPVGNGRLSLLKVPANVMEDLRTKLSGLGILIT